MSETKTVPMPVIPEELWMLWMCEDVPWWVPAYNDPGYLAFDNESDARVQARKHADSFGAVCIPVKVK